ncbi:hypothetical protein [Aneurinibacillus uraniidurans]|uniref:hypothetical protein n=1 Tax=Aneurinibacillus uraniidurans TaxID=2966586 RepID=UPI002349A938|nr:hypothetical protein [Aneurinibacillus sp. B1]WCN37345.1 hypothetical protein PO771_16280 [Aneurinibacillus sp. B1]
MKEIHFFLLLLLASLILVAFASTREPIAMTDIKSSDSYQSANQVTGADTVIVHLP